MVFLKAVFEIGFSQILGIYINRRYFTDMAKQMDMAWGNKAKSKSIMHLSNGSGAFLAKDCCPGIKFGSWTFSGTHRTAGPACRRGTQQLATVASCRQLRHSWFVLTSLTVVESLPWQETFALLWKWLPGDLEPCCKESFFFIMWTIETWVVVNLNGAINLQFAEASCCFMFSPVSVSSFQGMRIRAGISPVIPLWVIPWVVL